MPADSPIPEIPGMPVQWDAERQLQAVVCKTLDIPGTKFVGAQPISFTRTSLQELKTEDFFVAEKSDGIRVLMCCFVFNGRPEVYLVDRKNKFKYVPQLKFPMPKDDRFPPTQQYHDRTIVDGELVIDVQDNGDQVVRFLAFDILAFNGQSLTSRPLTKRLGYLGMYFLEPYKAALHKNPGYINNPPFTVSAKDMKLSYAVQEMYHQVLPNLKHGYDGLIFTSAVAPYVAGTNQKMIKWKPPNENSVDFKLSVKGPGGGSAVKPVFELLQWEGGNSNSFYAKLNVSDEQWNKWFTDHEILQDRVVEVTFDPKTQSWQFFRFRDDKEYGNHASVVQKVMQSIRDGVEKDELLAEQGAIRDAWKARNKPVK